MKCQRCVQEGLTSKVYSPNGGSMTHMRTSKYYDEEGLYHNHNSNRITKTYYCDKQHRWEQTLRIECPVKECNWNIRIKIGN